MKPIGSFYVYLQVILILIKQKMEHFCSYCKVLISSDTELQAHCSSEGHQLAIMSDEEREWKYRAPPRGVGADQYGFCAAYTATGKCRLGQLCCDAHGENELTEWKERFEYRQMKLQRAKENLLQGSSYTEQLLEKWLTSSSPNQIMKESLENVHVSVSPDLNITVSEKNCARDWTFYLSSNAHLRHVALLYETHRNHFRLAELTHNQSENNVKEYKLGPQCQEWSNPDNVCDSMEYRYTCKVKFVTAIYGTFRQAVIFDFGFEPVLVQRLGVDVVSVSDLEKLQQARESMVSFTERWSNEDVMIVPFENKPYPLCDREESLLSCYPAPNSSKFTVSQAVMEPTLTKSNYCSRQHELLCIEEMAQYELLSRYNVQAQLHLTSCYLLTPNAATTAKYAHNGELFANMQLSSVLSEDSAPGRLVLTNCSAVLLASVKSKGEENRKVYEAIIEDKGKTVIYIRLSKKCVEDLKLKPDRDFTAEVQFQLNRLPICEMHFAVDRLHPASLVFPDITVMPPTPWNDNKNSVNLDPRLNPKQKEAVLAITTPLSIRLPPVLIIGPFGTGKTFTLAQAVKMLLEDPSSRVLVCTHSNSAADIYIREYLHPYVAEGHPEATPLRIYYRHRWVATVHPTVQQYCLVSSAGNNRTFNMPALEDIMKYRVIVTTLSTSRYLVQLGLEKGFFTHVLVDEAAQAMECEAIMPLSLANENTRVVLAGDHMQLSPEVYSQFAQDRNLHTSLLERLYDLYPESFSCKILLCENYRSHEAIIQYTSELFYDNHLLASGKQPRHETYYPLTFFTARGEDVQDLNSTAFHNNAEVYEIVERVIELKKSWPEVWGEQDETSIGVVTPYYDQVVRIRAELRKKKLHGVSVERVLNVQGKQFRVIFLSAVRTRRTCSSLVGKPKSSESELDHGFLSNAKLLNTAITRAQSLVAVVGDPVSLCSVGKCRKLWEKFIHTCHKEKSLFGITWDSLRSLLDGMELKKNFVLNPLAPEFVPGRLYHGQPCVPQFSGEPICPNPSAATMPPPWLLLPLPLPVPPMLQPPVAHMVRSPHPCNLGLNFLPPSMLAPPPSTPQNFFPCPAPPRTSVAQPKLPSAIYSRRFGSVRGPVLHVEHGPVKELERNVVNGRPMKRNDGQQSFSSASRQTCPRQIEERNPNHEENDGQRIIGRSEQHSVIHSSTDSTADLPSFHGIQNGLFCLEDNRSERQMNMLKPSEQNEIIVKQNGQNNVPHFQDFNHINAFSEQQFQPIVKPAFANGSLCSLPNSTKLTSDVALSDNGNMNNSEGYHQISENYPPQPVINRLLPSCDIVPSPLNEREKTASMTFENQMLSPFPPVSQTNNGHHSLNKWPAIESPQNFDWLEVVPPPPVNAHTSLQEKLLHLQTMLPPHTDIKLFINSQHLQAAVYKYLFMNEGRVAAKRFLNILDAIKKDCEYLSRNNHMNGFSERTTWSKPDVFSPRDVPNFSVATPVRNGLDMPFCVPSTIESNPCHTDLPQPPELFRNELPVSSFVDPRAFANNNNRAENAIFLPEDKNVNKSLLNMNHRVRGYDFGPENFSRRNGVTLDRSAVERLPLEFSRGLSLGNRGEVDFRNAGLMSTEDHCDVKLYEPLRQSENKINSQNRDLRKHQWMPGQNQPSEQSVLGNSHDDALLIKLRSITSALSTSERERHRLLDGPLPEAPVVHSEREVAAPMTAGPLSTSYPDIPDILTAQILPRKESVSSKVIQRPNPIRPPVADGPLSNIQQSQFLFELSQPNNSSPLQYSHLTSEGMTYAKILRSPQP